MQLTGKYPSHLIIFLLSNKQVNGDLSVDSYLFNPREIKIRVIFSYRGGIVKIIKNYYNFRMVSSSHIFIRWGFKGVTPLKCLNKKINSVQKPNFPKRNVFIF